MIHVSTVPRQVPPPQSHLQLLETYSWAIGVEVLSWVCSHFSSRPPYLSMHPPVGPFPPLAASDSPFTSLTTAQSPDLSFAFRILERVFAFGVYTLNYFMVFPLMSLKNLCASGDETYKKFQLFIRMCQII